MLNPSQTPYIGGRANMAILNKNGYELRFWAERGLVRCEDSRDNSYTVMSIKTFLHRVKGINDMLGNSREDRRGLMHEDKVQDLRRFIDQALSVAKQAQEQGSPDDPSARRDAVRRLPATVIVPDNIGKVTF